jgi:hypothetical protein
MPPPNRGNPFFALTAAFAALFVVTILILVATVFGDPAAPMARLIDRYGGGLLAVEVIGLLVCGFVAMAVDRRQSSASIPSASTTDPSTASREQHDAEHRARD